jgi:diacylglycerol O-acyltransferase
VSSRYARLSPIDFMMLRTETESAPTHVGGLCVLKAGPQLTDIEQLKARLRPRVAAIPELHRVVRQTPPLCGPPLWIDDPAFSIDRHVFRTVVRSPGDEQALLDTAAELLGPRLSRSKPLWELWVLAGLPGDRVGMLFKVHHALADGMAAVRLVTTLLNDRLPPQSPGHGDTAATGSPTFAGLLRDNLANRLGALGVPFRHPLRNVRVMLPALGYSIGELRGWRDAPQTSINRIVGPERCVRVLPIDLEAARAVAHAHGGKINDVVVAIVTAGIGQVLRRRGEAVGDDLIAAMAVNLRDSGSAQEAGNVVGALRVRLPTGERDPERLLETVAQRTMAAKAHQRVSRQSSNVVLGFVGWLATVGVSFANSQRMINFFVSNVQGTPVPIQAFGVDVEEVLPIIGLFGNESVSFVAFSYCGRLNLVTVADAAAWPDIDVLSDGMAESWRGMAGGTSRRTPNLAARAGGRR